jgi:hypothetical protein
MSRGSITFGSMIFGATTSVRTRRPVRVSAFTVEAVRVCPKLETTANSVINKMVPN